MDKNTLKKHISNNWYWYIAVLLFIVEAAVFLICNENSYIGIHDNLDIHIADYQVLKLNHAFFAQDMELPILGGLNRDFFLTEWSLYAFLYMIFPNFTAYIIGYFMKIGIALCGGILLGRDVLKEKYRDAEWLIVLGSLTYGLLPLYPAFSFSYASIPYFIYLIRKLEKERSMRWYLLLFLYPLVSYFIFFGIFLIGYFLVYTIYRSIRNRKLMLRLFGGIACLSAGFVLAEYRLFRLIFLGNEATIRDTMQNGANDALGVVREIGTAFYTSIFHAEDLHRFFVLPVVMLYFIVLNAGYIYGKRWREMTRDCFNLILLFIIFNSVVYGLYTWEDFRTLFETMIPPLKGWQFNRTVFFNPFLWYLEIAIIGYRLMAAGRKKAAMAVMGVTLLVVLGKQSLYNDFYNTVYTNAYKIIKQKDTESLSYKEFYSCDLFEKIKQDIQYDGEYAAAYGFHPAVLSYNGISTLDACFSYYHQSYKEAFRRVIEPALEKSETARIYYDDWGGRAYIFSGTDESIWSPVKTMKVTDNTLYINAGAFKELGGTYIFSRIKISNADELELTLKGEYSDPASPYRIYVYCN